MAQFHPSTRREWRGDEGAGRVLPARCSRRIEVEYVRQRPDVMTWLGAGVPVTLIVDLLDPAGPNSAAIFHAERDRSAQTGPWLTALIGHVAEQFTVAISEE